jgi:hypothetical protein
MSPIWHMSHLSLYFLVQLIVTYTFFVHLKRHVSITSNQLQVAACRVRSAEDTQVHFGSFACTFCGSLYLILSIAAGWHW